MIKILFTLSILFSITSFAGDRGGSCDSGGNCGNWPNFKNECERNGGYASPVPSQCSAAMAAAAGNSNVTYTSLQDGNSPNQKCCVKCNTALQSLGNNSIAAQQKCNNSNGAIWIPLNPPKTPGCCFKPQTLPSPTPTPTGTTQAVAVRNKMCPPGTTYVLLSDANPIPTSAATCTTSAHPTWAWNSFGVGSCCKPNP